MSADTCSRLFFEHSAGGIVCADLAGRVDDANRAAAAVLGYATGHELIGQDLRTWFADAREGEAFVRGGPLEHAAVWHRRDGGLAHVELRVQRLEGAPARHAIFIRDVSELHEREQREATLREHRQAAIAASRAKTEFLANMSHELRTPLNGVLGLSEALLERTFGELNSAQASTLKTIHDSGRHLLALINDVLDIARVEIGKLPIELEAADLRPVVEESIALVFGQLIQKRQRLVRDLQPTAIVEIDRRRIKQVLLNLLTNASKFSAANATITVRTAARGSHVEVSVSDTGCGIAAGDRERIFEPFVTLDASVRREHQGAGLGLALVKQIAELHHGTVRVDSEPGRGTTFTVSLPVEPPAAVLDDGDRDDDLLLPRLAGIR
ncbi:MAG: PAS domain S-box protein [Deltaproteobacteria bacterium]|nr:PAS domain S-box protein [Deltaproteobacteria bacterium]